MEPHLCDLANPFARGSQNWRAFPQRWPQQIRFRISRRRRKRARLANDAVAGGRTCVNGQIEQEVRGEIAGRRGPIVLGLPKSLVHKAISILELFARQPKLNPFVLHLADAVERNELRAVQEPAVNDDIRDVRVDFESATRRATVPTFSSPL